MPVKLITRITLLLIILLSNLFLKDVSAEDIIYNNNFENDSVGNFPNGFTRVRNRQHLSGLPCKNGDDNAEWSIFNVNGNKKVGITIDGPSCVNEIVPTSFHLPDPEHYSYEVDMTFVNSTDLHRNISFKYTDDGNWYGMKIFNNYYVEIQKVVGINWYYDLGSFNYNNLFYKDTTYKFLTVINEENVKIYINNQLVFDKDEESHILKPLTIALQASCVDDEDSNTVYFDNMIVKDLSLNLTPTPTPTVTPTITPTPTPTLTPTLTPTIAPPVFPYFSQRDPIWKSDQYDHLNKTIGEVGCALTSAAMVLKSYGINKVPWGNQLRDMNPQNLNNWLNTTAEKYWRGGRLNWSTISSLTVALNSSPSANSRKLELEVIASNVYDRIDSILTNDQHPVIINQPAVLSPSGTHFVVAHTKRDPIMPALHSYAIADPWNQSRDVTSIPTDHISTGYHYYPTSSDFRYLWLNADPQIQVSIEDLFRRQSGFSVTHSGTLITENLIPESTFTLQPPLYEVDTQNPISSEFWQYSQKYPIKGTYKIMFYTDNPGWYNAEVYAYSKDSTVTFENLRFYLSKRPLNYELVYDPGLPTQTINRVVSFESLKQMILHTYSYEMIPLRVREQLYRFVDNAQKVYNQDPYSGKNLVRVFTTQILNDNKQKKMMDSGYYLLLDEATSLISIL